MPTDSASETAFASPYRRVDPQRLVAHWSAAAIVLAVPIMLLPYYILPNIVPLVVVLCATTATLLARLPSGSIRFDAVTPINLLFVSVGLLYVAASALQVLPQDPKLPLRPEFILRHSYYLLVWIPLMAGATTMFRNILPRLLAFAKSAALPALAALAVIDVASAALLGDPDKIEWEGYTYFLDGPILTFVYPFLYLLAVVGTGRIKVPLAIATLHWVVSNVTDYGMIFNTMTGTIVLALLGGFSVLSRRSWSLALYGALAFAGVIFAGLVAGLSFPELFGIDLNTHWRFLVWRENMLAALESGLIGVGFGTPYRDLSPGNIADAFLLSRFAEFTQYASGSPLDILYIRGQHSSFVNAFYRMGLLGGALLIAFHVAMLAIAVRATRSVAAPYKPIVAAGGVLFLSEAIQIAAAVGLESPRYLSVYALTVGFARAAASIARAAHD